MQSDFPTNFSDLSREEKLELLSSLSELSDRIQYDKLSVSFPESGEYARSNYQKHVDFLNSTETFRQSALMGGNRVGKTYVGSYAAAMHLTGKYPDWYTGKRFDKPINMWACGINNTRVRDTLQEMLLGRYGELGTGFIPKDCIIDVTTKPGTPKGILDVWVKHESGGSSHLIFKSYVEDVESYMGTAQDVVWFDEEPPEDIYTESLMRLATTGGILYCTFTPLNGYSNVVMSFLNDGMFPSIEQMKQKGKFVERIEWADVPHIADEVKEEYEKLPPHEREARIKGIPTVGEGKVYPVPENDFVINPIELNPSWPRCYGLDVGWRMTAGIFGAYDPQNDIWYLYDEYYVEKENPAFHASNLRKKSQKWVPGVIDPSAAGAGKQHDGFALLDAYRQEDLDLYPANNSVDIGLRAVYDRLVTGRLKVFSNCQHLLREFRIYRRDGKGRIVKSNDHLMDAKRYLIMSGIDHAITMPDIEGEYADSLKGRFSFTKDNSRNPTTGY